MSKMNLDNMVRLGQTLLSNYFPIKTLINQSLAAAVSVGHHLALAFNILRGMYSSYNSTKAP